MTALIEARGLTKRFGSVTALDGLDLHLPPGRIVAILGPNGAGKTTFVRTVATLLAPESGSLLVAGHDVVGQPLAVRRMIGLAGQSAAVEEMMTGRENLTMVARLYGQSRRSARASGAAILDQLGLGRGGRSPGSHLLGRDAAAPRSRAPAWSALPVCFCSTSPPPGSTRGVAWPFGNPSGRSAMPVPTSCSPRSTLTRPTTWPISS